MLNALVYGWYGKGIDNIGDMLFCQAFKYLFPDINFTFTNYLSQAKIDANDCLIFGGGSFLYSAPDGAVNCNFANKQILYIGVGLETDIHPIHKNLMQQASLIAFRNTLANSDRVNLNKSCVIQIPDLVYSLQAICKPSAYNTNSILVLPNAELLPTHSDSNWKHAAWNYFKSEFSQFLDEKKSAGATVHFAPFCTIPYKHDLGAATEIINQMLNRDFGDQIFSLPSDIVELVNFISRYELIISQRYHGAIISHMALRPCIALAHHDKLKNINDYCETISYYELSKKKLHDTYFSNQNKKILPIKLDKFRELQEKFYSLFGMKCLNSSV